MSDTLDPRALETAHAAAMYEAGAHIHEDAIAAGIAAYLAASPQPANPAQVTEADRKAVERLTAELAKTRKGISEPDLLSMSSGIIQLHYEDLDVAQAAFDWLETLLARKGE